MAKNKDERSRSRASDGSGGASGEGTGGGLDWKRLHLWDIQPLRDVLFFAAILAVFYVGYLVSIVTVPLLLAVLLAYLLEPVVARITRTGRIKRFVAAGGLIGVVAFVLIVPVGLGLTYGIVSGVAFAQGVTENAVALGRVLDARDEEARAVAMLRLPNESWRRFADTLDEWGGELDLGRRAEHATPDQPEPPIAAGEEPGADEDEPAHRSLLVGIVSDAVGWAREHRGTIGQTAAQRGVDVLGATIRGFTTLGMIVFGGFLTAFFFFFISSSYAKVVAFGGSLVPHAHRDQTLDLLTKMDRVIAGFVRGRLTIAFIQSIVFSIGYFLIGTPAALLVGIGVGVLSIVPYLAMIGIPVSIALMFLDPAEGFRGAWWWILIAPVAWYAVGQALDDYVLTPKIQGESTGLDTPTVLFASIAGGALAGFYGLLIAIPIAACLKILVREVFWPRFNEWVAGRRKDPLPIGRSDEG